MAQRNASLITSPPFSWVGRTVSVGTGTLWGADWSLQGNYSRSMPEFQACKIPASWHQQPRTLQHCLKSSQNILNPWKSQVFCAKGGEVSAHESCGSFWTVMTSQSVTWPFRKARAWRNPLHAAAGDHRKSCQRLSQWMAIDGVVLKGIFAQDAMPERQETDQQSSQNHKPVSAKPQPKLAVGVHKLVKRCQEMPRYLTSEPAWRTTVSCPSHSTTLARRQKSLRYERICWTPIWDTSSKTSKLAVIPIIS